MATLTAKSLALGELSGTGIDTLYDNPASTVTRIKTVIFHNTDTVYRPVTIYGTVSGTDYPIAYQYLSPKSTWVYELQHPLILSADAHVLKAESDSTGVTFFVCGLDSATPTTPIVPKHIGQGTGTGIVYTVPANTTFYLYHVLMYASNAATFSAGYGVQISITDPAGPTTKNITDWCGRANDYWCFDTPIVLEAGWDLTVTAGTGLTVWLDGAEEDLTP